MIIGGSADSVGEKINPSTHAAVLAAVYDLGVRQHPKFGPRHECCLWWETATRDTQGRQFGVRDVVGANLSPKGWLAKRIAALLGRALTDEEVRCGIDLSALIGHSCLITLEAPRSNPNGYPLVVGAVPLLPGMPGPNIEGDYSQPPPFVRRVLEDKTAAAPAAAPAPAARPSPPAARPSPAPVAPAAGAPGVPSARPSPAPALRTAAPAPAPAPRVAPPAARQPVQQPPPPAADGSDDVPF